MCTCLRCNKEVEWLETHSIHGLHNLFCELCKECVWVTATDDKDKLLHPAEIVFLHIKQDKEKHKDQFNAECRNAGMNSLVLM